MSDKKAAWFSAFINVVPADYEKWLEDLALQGWNIDKIGQWSSIRMVFKHTTPKRYRYVFDMQAAPKKDYKATYEQFGWEFVGQMASAFIWRKEYDGDKPESFSDAESVIKRNTNVMYAVMVSFILFLITSVVLTVSFVLFFSTLNLSDILQFIFGCTLSYLFTIYLGYVIDNINKNRLR